MAEVGKPGTNWLQVGPAERKKLSPLVRHYMKKPHPFTACVRDNTKRFGKERAERVCAVVKDIGHGGTGWRKGGKKLKEACSAAYDRLGAVEAVLGDGAALRIAEAGCPDADLERVVLDDLAVLTLAGLPYDAGTLREAALSAKLRGG